MGTKRFITISVAFLLPCEVHQSAVSLSTEISKRFKTIFTLGDRESVPHVTIYFNEYPKSNIDNILESANVLAEEFGRTKVEFTRFCTGRGYIDMGIGLSKQLVMIHKRSVKLLFPQLKTHLREKYLESSEKYSLYSEKQKRNIKRYGHPDVMDLYRPHVTLTRLENEDDAKDLVAELKWPIKNCVLDSIGVFEMGEHGSCQRLIKKLKLKNKT